MNVKSPAKLAIINLCKNEAMIEMSKLPHSCGIVSGIVILLHIKKKKFAP